MQIQNAEVAEANMVGKTGEMRSIPIIYIAGAGRSGSTALGEALGMFPGALHLGETQALFDYIVDPSNLYVCSCGKSYQDCNFWNPLLIKLFGEKWPSRISSYRFKGKIPSSKALLWRYLLRLDNSSSIEQIAKVLPVMETALTETNLHVVVDSSKTMPFAWLLAQTGRVKMLFIHLIRDPRGVVFSWLKHPIALPDSRLGYSTVRTLTFFSALIEWVKSNTTAYFFKLLGFPYISLKYEDFVADPEHTLLNVIMKANEVGIPIQASEDAFSLLRQRKINLTGHLILGNPRLKTKRGEVKIKLDDEWRSETPVLVKVLLSVLLIPWLVSYSYFGRK